MFVYTYRIYCYEKHLDDIQAIERNVQQEILFSSPAFHDLYLPHISSALRVRARLLGTVARVT